MSTCGVEDAAVFNHQVDDLLLDARGLVLVREVLARRGATRAELDAHTQELKRVRRRLVAAIEGRDALAMGREPLLRPSSGHEGEPHLVGR
jgi:hypothetical protein